jgi:hypothetical protein
MPRSSDFVGTFVYRHQAPRDTSTFQRVGHKIGGEGDVYTLLPVSSRIWEPLVRRDVAPAVPYPTNMSHVVGKLLNWQLQPLAEYDSSLPRSNPTTRDHAIVW